MTKIEAIDLIIKLLQNVEQQIAILSDIKEWN